MSILQKEADALVRGEQTPNPLGLMTMEERFRAAAKMADWWKRLYEDTQSALEELQEKGYVLDGIRLAMERRGYAGMANGRDIGRILDAMGDIKAENIP